MPGSRDLRRLRVPSTPATHVYRRPHPRPQARARDRDFRRAPNSPACSRVGALQVLHLSENVSEMLAVLAAFAVPGVPSILGTLERRLGQYLVDTPEPRHLNVGQPR